MKQKVESPPRSDPTISYKKLFLVNIERLYDLIMYNQFYREFLTKYLNKIQKFKPTKLLCRYVSSTCRKLVRTTRRLHFLYKFFNKEFFSFFPRKILRKMLVDHFKYYDINMLPNNFLSK